MNSALRDEFRFASGGGKKTRFLQRGARVLWYSNSPAMWRRSHAIGRATIRLRPRCAKARPSSISSSSRAMTARRRSGVQPGWDSKALPPRRPLRIWSSQWTIFDLKRGRREARAESGQAMIQYASSHLAPARRIARDSELARRAWFRVPPGPRQGGHVSIWLTAQRRGRWSKDPTGTQPALIGVTSFGLRSGPPLVRWS
jgi:hypothetical protein